MPTTLFAQVRSLAVAHWHGCYCYILPVSTYFSTSADHTQAWEKSRIH